MYLHLPMLGRQDEAIVAAERAVAAGLAVAAPDLAAAAAAASFPAARVAGLHRRWTGHSL